MHRNTVILIGAPVDSGKRRPGCLMGPDAYRTAGLPAALRDLGYKVEDMGNLTPASHNPDTNDGKLFAPNETIAWTHRLTRTAETAMQRGMPIFMGGDHSLSLGSVAGVAAAARAQGRPLFVLWLDAHSDFHTTASTQTGNLHGTPVAYLAGRSMPEFPPFPAVVPPENICLFGIRSVDAAEHAALLENEIAINDMRVLDEHGVVKPLKAFLDRVHAADGLLHVSLDVDFLDPMIAPAVGTTVPGGATFREAHLVMELLHDSGLVSSLDLVELNPFLDERGRTAHLMVDLVASLMGRKVFDRPTRSYRGQA